jgi:RHS repeat-associated protein
MDVYNGSNITSYYFHTNEIGSTTEVTDADGNVVERYKYGLYGNPTFMDAAGNVIPNSAIGNNILFQGREYEPETNFYYFRARHLDPIMGRFLQTDPMGYEDSLNLYQSFNMNPVNFVDPFGRQSFMAEEELMKEEILKEHLKKRYGATKGEQYYQEMTATKRRIETIMVASFGVGLGTAMVAPHLSVPTIIATVGSISTYSALESYSKRKQAGQTEREARRGAFGAATGFNFLFNLMGFDYGTLEAVSQEQVENAWSTLIGGAAGVWFAKMLTAPAAEIVATDSGIVKNWGPLEGHGPLGKKVANTFRSSTYNEVILDEDIILYRVYSDPSKKLGPYWTRTEPSGPVQSIIDSALNPKWGNKATSVIKIKVPKGTTIYEGVAAPQGGLVGGGNQVVIKKVEESWIIQ